MGGVKGVGILPVGSDTVVKRQKVNRKVQGVPDTILFYCHLDNLERDPEIQHPKFENSRLGFIESVHES